MGLRYSKSLKIARGLRLNISKSGISVSAGVKGARVSFGPRGTYLNVGLPGTGLSYSQKIGDGYKTKSKKKSSSSTVKKQNAKEIEKNNVIVEDYNAANDIYLNVHKRAENVVNKETFDKHINEIKDENKDFYQRVIDGDSQTIEELIEKFMNSLELQHEINVSYQLDGHTLLVDLDLPEVEDMNPEYPVVNSSGDIQMKKKTQTVLKEEYARVVLSIAIYLATNYFNLSSYIETINMSGYTQRRNSTGDEEDTYIYSVIFTRDIFEKTDISEISEPKEFFQQFTNRMNLSASNIFKAIIPYQQSERDNYIADAIEALKALGYKPAEINLIKPALSELKLSSAQEYLKEGLKLLASEK